MSFRMLTVSSTLLARHLRITPLICMSMNTLLPVIGPYTISNLPQIVCMCRFKVSSCQMNVCSRFSMPVWWQSPNHTKAVSLKNLILGPQNQHSRPANPVEVVAKPHIGSTPESLGSAGTHILIPLCGSVRHACRISLVSQVVT